MKRVPRLMQGLRQKPGIYLGHGSLPLLSAYLNGYIHGEGEEAEEISRLLAEFQEWVRTYYAISTAHSWSDIIQFFERSESGAFGRFFQLLDQFLEESERATSVPRPEFTDESEPKEYS